MMNVPRMPDTWIPEDAPVLVAAITCLDRDGDADGHAVSGEAGLDEDIVVRSLHRLSTGGYIHADFAMWPFPRDNQYMSLDRLSAIQVTGATEKARRAAGQWPSSEALTEDLLAALKQMTETGDGDEKSRARKILDAMTDGGARIMSDALATVLLRTTGMAP